MKSWIWGFIGAALLFGAVPLVAEDVYRIEIGKNHDRDLERRVQRLEQAVDQLQRKVFDLESRPVTAPSSAFTTCYIKTPFDGTFTAASQVDAAARAGALEKCNAKAKSSIYCDEKDVKCGK